MSATLVAHTAKAGTSGGNTTTTAIDTTGATFLIVNVGSNNAGLTISDSKGNTWFRILSQQTNPVQSVFVSIPTSVGSGHTFTTAGGNFAGVAVQAWSGTTGLMIPVNANSAAGTITTGSITAPGATTSPNLFIAGFACDGTANATIDGSFTISDFQIGVSGQSFGSGLAYKQSSGTESPTWTRASGTGKNAAFLICIGVTGAGGGSGGGSYGFA